MVVEVRDPRSVRRWCSEACRARAVRRRRILMIADALEGDEAARQAALETLRSEIERARNEEARQIERIVQQQAKDAGQIEQEANDE